MSQFIASSYFTAESKGFLKYFQDSLRELELSLSLQPELPEATQKFFV